MRVYFYHTQDIQHILSEIGEGRFPSHFLYGATHLKDHGIDVVWHQSRIRYSRIKRMLYTTWQILKNYRGIDAVYATHYTGIEPVIFLRALNLFRKPIVIWHHQPIITPKSRMREILGKLFYKGIDEMFFFSQKLIDDSLKSKKAKPERMHLGHWGADMDFYDRIIKTGSASSERSGFISTGKELRDMPTLVSAFNNTGEDLTIYLNHSNGDFSYEKLFHTLETKDNIHLHFIDRLMPGELAEKVDRAACVVICCQETKYTVGLTTLVEALALGLPIICSRNPQFPIDVDSEGCGISVAYKDIDGWEKAIKYISQHPEEAERMGRKGREIAETRYNEMICAREAANLLLSVCRHD